MLVWIMALLLVPIFNVDAWAVDIDEDLPRAKITVKPGQDNAQAEIKRLKKQLAAEKRKRAGSESAVKPEKKAPEIEMVRLSSGIAIGKYELTQGQWQAVMGSSPVLDPACGDRCPVNRVSWDEVQKFIQRLNQLSGKRFRLPTSHEWYEACQAGQNNKYCGSDDVNSVAWYVRNSDIRPHSVGEKQPNAWGLYDMGGNVEEWTDSCDKDSCHRRVAMGGGYRSQTYEFSFPPSFLVRNADSTDSDVGFRLVEDH